MLRPLREIITQVAEILKSGGIANYYAEARALVSVVLDRPANQVHPAMNSVLTDDQINNLLCLSERRKNGEPLQLITGYVGFYNNVLMCERDVFIPRIETEVLVTKALNHLSDFPVDKTAMILELGTGTGAILISLACEDAKHHYYGVDNSEKAVELARKNAASNKIQDRATFFLGDYFNVVKKWDRSRFDMIISNPPYIRSEDIKNLSVEVKDWDPVSALDGGADGLDHYRIISNDLAEFLKPEGIALFEIDPDYVIPLSEIFKSKGFHVSDIYKDYDGNDRVMQICRSNI